MLQAMIKNQEIARAETRGGFDRIDAGLRNIYRIIGGLELFQAEMTGFRAEMLEFKTEMTEFQEETRN